MSLVAIIFFVLLLIFIFIAGLFVFLYLKARKTAETVGAENEKLTSAKSNLTSRITVIGKANENLWNEKTTLSRQLSELNTKFNEYTSRFQNIINADTEKDRILAETGQLHQRH